MLKTRTLEVVERLRTPLGRFYRCRDGGKVVTLSVEQLNARIEDERKQAKRARFDGHDQNVAIRLRKRRVAKRNRDLLRALGLVVVMDAVDENDTVLA